MRTALTRCLLLVAFAAPSAHAAYAPLTAQQVLQQFNLVTLGNATMSSHVDGRAYIGGSLSGAGAVAAMVSPLPTSNYAALTVAGNASGVTVNNNSPSTAVGAVVGGDLTNSSVNNGGAVVMGNSTASSYSGSGTYYVAGTVSGGNLNISRTSTLSSSTSLNNAASAATSTNMASVMTTLSNQLAALSANSTGVKVSNRSTFTATPDSSGLAVFNVTADLLSAGEFSFALGAASTLIFNVDASVVNISANFLDSVGGLASKAIWNFNKATSITFGTSFAGTVLATGATLTNKGNVDGNVIVSSLDQQGEIHLYNFTGTVPGGSSNNTVPEPGTLGLLALAGLLGWRQTRRRAAHA